MASPKVTVRDGKCRGGKAVREAPSKKGWDKMIPSGMKNENHFGKLSSVHGLFIKMY